jgi:hypothetical protein
MPNVTTASDLDLARAAFDGRAWSEAVRRFEAADAAGGLDLADVERLGVAHRMLGRPDLAIDVWERGHTEALAAGQGLVAGASFDATAWIGVGLVAAGRADQRRCV